MKLPRDLSGRELTKALNCLGYVTSHQTGSHMRLTTQLNGEHHLTIPDHDSLRIGTLSAILREVETHVGLPREEIVARLFG